MDRGPQVVRPKLIIHYNIIVSYTLASIRKQQTLPPSPSSPFENSYSLKNVASFYEDYDNRIFLNSICRKLEIQNISDRVIEAALSDQCPSHEFISSTYKKLLLRVFTARSAQDVDLKVNKECVALKVNKARFLFLQFTWLLKEFNLKPLPTSPMVLVTPEQVFKQLGQLREDGNFS